MLKRFLLNWNAFPKFLSSWHLNLSLNPASSAYEKCYDTARHKSTVRQWKALRSQTGFADGCRQLHWAGSPSTSQVTESFGPDRRGRLVLKVSLLMRKFTVVAPSWESPFTSCRVFNLKNWQWALHSWSQLMWRGRGWEAAFEITPRYH